MTREMTPRTAVHQFASTFREWHYFIGGAAVGFFVGAEWALRRFGDG